MTQEWMTRKQVAELLQVSEVSIYRWTREGKLQAYKFGRTVRYRRQEVESMARPEQGSPQSEVWFQLGDCSAGPSPAGDREVAVLAARMAALTPEQRAALRVLLGPDGGSA